MSAIATTDTECNQRQDYGLLLCDWFDAAVSGDTVGRERIQALLDAIPEPPTPDWMRLLGGGIGLLAALGRR